MIKYKLDGQEFTIPSGWNEVTLRQWLKLRDTKKGFIPMIAVLSNLPETLWFNTSEVDIELKLLPMLDWIKDTPDFAKSKAPTEVIIDGKLIKVPQDIKLKTFGQKITFQEKMAKHVTEEGLSIEFAKEAIAIYLYPETPFDDLKAKEWEDKVLDLPVEQAYALSTFFFSRYVKQLNLKDNYSPKSQMLKKSEQVWKRLVSSVS